MVNKFDSKSAIILGMHDALVSLTGLIAGLYFAFNNTHVIVISCILASITAALSMGAANYLAVKTINKKHALISAFYTSGAYMVTCIFLIFPFLVFRNHLTALIATLITAIFIIFFFNRFFYRGKSFYKNFYEMLAICTTVSIVAFFIGEIASQIFGI
jgi:VIT1/CCC1 family predicted Fe2+/Mn2+ transporter